jgi:uncharacterized protein
VGERERVVSLDVLRGFALCGVLMGNLVWLYTGRFIDGPPSPPTTFDRVAFLAFTAFVENKAFTILTFLFGFGFANILVRAQQRGESGTGLFVRRLVVLFALGWCHVIFLWYGDITWTYATIGFALLLFRNASNTSRIICGLLFAIAPYTLWQWLDDGMSLEWFMSPEEWLFYAKQYVSESRSAGYFTMMRENIQFALVWSAPIVLWYPVTLVGRFLLGYVAGAQRWFDRDGADHLRMFRWFVIGGLAIGLPCAATIVLDRLDVLGYELLPVPGSLVFTLQLMGMAAAYIGIVVLLVQRPRWKRALSIVAPVGRMALTTYVMQSLIATTLFWGRGLGWHTPRASTALGLSLVIFAVQIAIAHLWLRRFRFGPLEWVWRSLVYMKRQPMRV